LKLQPEAVHWLEGAYQVIEQLARDGRTESSKRWCGNDRMDDRYGWLVGEAHRLTAPDAISNPTTATSTQKVSVDLYDPEKTFDAQAWPVFVQVVRDFQQLQPLYLIPKTPANVQRIQSQAKLLRALCELVYQLERTQMPNHLGRMFDFLSMNTPGGGAPRLHPPNFAVYFEVELKLSEQVGILPM
jgi:hypothetical protein